MKTMTEIENEIRQRFFVDVAKECGKHDAAFEKYQPEDRASEYQRKFRSDHSEIEHARCESFITEYTAAYDDQIELQKQLGEVTSVKWPYGSGGRENIQNA